jgi:hypothetical protein
MDDHGAHQYYAQAVRDDLSETSTVPDEDDTSSTSESMEEVRFGIRNTRDSQDVEANRPELIREKSTRTIKDPNLVGRRTPTLDQRLTIDKVAWESPEDPENPKNWTYRKKWAATLIVSSFTFISPVSSSMVAPALNKIGQDLGVESDIEKSLMLSIFVLAYAIGPLFLGPLSEIYGRVIVLQLSNLFFLAFNIGCGFAQSKGQLIAFRFLSGLGGSAPLALGGGVLSDCWRAEERGKSISIYSLAPLLGPAVGPIAGGFIAMKVSQPLPSSRGYLR